MDAARAISPRTVVFFFFNLDLVKAPGKNENHPKMMVYTGKIQNHLKQIQDIDLRDHPFDFLSPKNPLIFVAQG